jgi:hypothetical protein
MITLNDLYALYLLIQFKVIQLSIKLLSHWSTIIANAFLGIKTQPLEFERAPLQDYVHKMPIICYVIVV